MSCCQQCDQSGLGALARVYGLRGLGAMLTAGSRVVYQGETEGGIFDTSSLLNEFRRFLQQRGLTVENITFESLGVTLTGARMIRVFAQVVTPIDRAQEADLTFDMTQDLQRAANAPVENNSLSVMVRASKDQQGNPVYPGGSPSLPTTTPPPPDPDEKSFWEEIADELEMKKSEAKLLVFGAGAVLLILVTKR